MITVAIIGLGARGAEVYGAYSLKYKNEMKVVAISDISEEKVNKYKKIYQVPDENCFSTGEELLSKEKLADAIIIASPDNMHHTHTLKALELGYHVLLEKPIAPKRDECIDILKKAKETNRIVSVCHVLRYAPFFKTIKEIVDSGKIGEVVHLNQIENVGYWHQAHSFVRGNWRNSIESSPMILAKSCHDLDIISWIINKKCEKVSSFGSLKHFRKENAPVGSSSRCLDCKVRDTCPYDAVKIYLDNFAKYEDKEVWPFIVLDNHPTEESLTKALRHGPYGRCVYDCDNDVVDHQCVNMQFVDGITASFTMSAFSGATHRQIKIMGTKGEIIGDDLTQEIQVKIYDGSFEVKPEIINIKELHENLTGHGGGDELLVADFINLIKSEKGDYLTSIDQSIQSHIMAFSAEESRINDGKVIKINY